MKTSGRDSGPSSGHPQLFYTIHVSFNVVQLISEDLTRNGTRGSTCGMQSCGNDKKKFRITWKSLFNEKIPSEKCFVFGGNIFPMKIFSR